MTQDPKTKEFIRKARKPRGYWTKERCLNKSEACKRRTEFQRRFPAAYDAAQRNGWLNEIYSHMPEIRKPNNYWTKERCWTESKKCKTHKEFRLRYPSGYDISLRNGWLKEINSHLTYIQRPPSFWTINRLKTLIKNYRTLSEFSKKQPTAYSICIKRKLGDKLFSKLIRYGHKYKRCIYVYEFPGKFAYIGLTFNLDKRHIAHTNPGSESAVWKHIVTSKNQPLLKQLTKYIDVHKASKTERYYANKYKKNGWTLLNRVKTGSTGGSPMKWNFTTLSIEAKKYKRKVDFKKNSGGAYATACNLKIINNICSHMTHIRNSNRYWTKNKVSIEAKRHKYKIDFRKNNPKAYDAAVRNQWIDEVCKHMIETKKKNGYWNDKNLCKKEAKKFNERTLWKNGSPSSYSSAQRNGWINECSKHMTSIFKPHGYWNKENCICEVKKYDKISEFKKFSSGAYDWVSRNGFLKQFIKYLKPKT